MCVRYCIASLIIVSANCADDSLPNDYEETVHEGSSREMKISATLSFLITKINRKFDAVQEKLSDLQHDMDILKMKNLNLDEKVENKFDMLRKKHHDLEDNILEKINKLENNIIDRLEGYIYEKTDYLAKHINRKIDEKEIIIPRIRDIKVIANKMDVLQINQADLGRHVNYTLQELRNETVRNEEVIKKVNEIQMNIYELKNRTSDFNFSILNKHKIKLEDRIDLLEKNMINKTDTLEDKIAVINSINSNDELKKNQIELHESIIEKLKLLVNEAQGKVYDQINRKLNVIEENISKVKNVTTHIAHAISDMKLTYFGDNLNSEIKKIIPTKKDIIKLILDAVDNKIIAHFEDKLSSQLNAMDKNILTIKDNITCNVTVSNNTTLQNIEHQLREIPNNISKVERNINKTTEASEISEKDVLAVKRTSVGCKERVVTEYEYETYYRLDDLILNHVTVNYDSAGGLAYLEMHLQIKGPEQAYLLLSAAPNTSGNDGNILYEIGVGTNNQTRTTFSAYPDISHINPKNIDEMTPNILSPSEFTAFYVKINEGRLEFGKEGGPPILELPDPRLKKMKYFSMTAIQETIFLYDCAATLEILM